MKRYLLFLVVLVSFCFNWNRVEAKSKLSREQKEYAGLDHNRFRYYNPQTGAYLSKDPIGLAGNNPNLYAYTYDSNMEVDVLGLLFTGAEMQPYRNDVLVKDPHADIFINGRKVTEARINSNGEWYRWGDLASDKKILKEADKIIASMASDPKIKAELIEQLKAGIDKTEEIMKYRKPNSGEYQLAERASKRLDNLHEKITGKKYKYK